ncbi:MAG: hypothetical protein RI911_395 [Candidatus Parcubacteria bacterium]|jgi:hypothetical protein
MFGTHHTIYVDLSINSVCVALAEAPTNKKHFKIIATRTAHFNDNHEHYHKALAALGMRLQELIQLLTREYTIKHYDVVFFVHSPLCTSRSVQHTYTFKKETVITKLHIQEVLNSARKTAQEKGTEGAASVFREYITSIALNGYPTDVPQGKTATEATCTIVQETLSGGVMHTIIEPVIRGGIKYEMYNYAQLVGVMLGSTAQEGHTHFGLAEITPEACEITFYAKRTLERSMIIPVGSRIILDAAEKHLHVTHEFIHGLLKASGEQSLSEDVQKSIDGLVTESAAVFKNILQEQHADITLFPPKMYLITERGTEQFWVSVLSRAFENQKLVPEKIVIDGKRLEYTITHDPAITIGIYAHQTTDHVITNTQ